jgi:hypothetical protein
MKSSIFTNFTLKIKTKLTSTNTINKTFLTEVLLLTQHITTGPHPGSSGACIAEYNHAILPHSYQEYHHNPNHNFSHHNHINPYI